MLNQTDEDNKEGAGDEQFTTAVAKIGQPKNFKQVMSAAYKENQLHNVVRFITDYLRQVIENGSRFTSGHFFIMLLQMSTSEVKNNSLAFIKILIEELQVPQSQFARFVNGLKDDKLSDAFGKLERHLYNQDEDLNR